jgi:hypothetical protein
MAVDLDATLTRLAARLLRNAARFYDRSDDETWFRGYNPVLTAWRSGMFGCLEMKDGPSSAALGRLFRLPVALPAVRLPPPSDLAASARSAPMMVKLVEFAEWLGHAGRPVTEDRALYEADAADAVPWLSIRPDQLPYLWEHAVMTGWFELADGPDGPRRWVMPGEIAYRWADADVQGTLNVWAAVFASVLTMSLEVTADQAPEKARLLNFQGQGVALAVILFLARQTGVTMGDASDIVRDGAIGDPPGWRAKKTWDAWVSEFGDPGRPLLRELAALRALALPSDDDGLLTLSPLAQWALRQQFTLDDIDVPVIPASGELSAADLVRLADVVSDTEFQAECEAWFSRRSPGRAARDLLMHAASADAMARVTAVNLVRQLGAAAGGAWTEAMKSPSLRGYARLALSGMVADSPESRTSLPRNLDPEELDGVVADLLTLIPGDEAPGQGRIAVRFAEVIPMTQAALVFSVLARSPNPGARRVLELVGRHHPERDIARDARKAARA